MRFLPGVSLKEKRNKSDRLDGDSQLIRVYPAVAAVALRTLAGDYPKMFKDDKMKQDLVENSSIFVVNGQVINVEVQLWV